MGEWKKRVSECSCFCSNHLVWFIVPFLMTFGFVSVLGSKTSSIWVFTPNKLAKPTHTNTITWQGGAGEQATQFQSPMKNESHRNGSLPVSSTMRVGKKYSNLVTIEAGLVQARAAIKEGENGNQIEDSNFVPKGPMYLNATAFHRSYMEMEKQFKVYIYEEGEPPIFHYGPCKHIYAIEGYFIQTLEVSPFRTMDPNKAHFFFLPFSVTMITQVVYVPDSHEWGPMKTTVLDYVNVIAQKHPYWNRSLGADHFMLACHDWAMLRYPKDDICPEHLQQYIPLHSSRRHCWWCSMHSFIGLGPELSFAVPHLYKHSIRAFCNANTSERFNPSKDVSIPEIHLPLGTMDGMIGGPSPSKRKILVFYAGGVHGPIRPILLEHWENKDEEVQVHKYLPKGTSYYGMMRHSRFCICPSGYEVASPRMVEALYMGCVPVLIKDGYVVPFSDVLNWKSFSVEIPVKNIPNMKKILMGISQRQYIRMQRRGIQVRRHFEVNSPPKRFDVFHMILHSIWLRRLNIRVNDIHHQEEFD